ncbi:hypothetical protein PROVALCAL_02799 [Providencia alcalifaciens DSM 30120]|uniref:Uncharacterized protein n=1 Tax=Providencia alcalifaciens DSM 30120 TaxID=520999 RepID=B6XHG1_9GAMM|nr:hypothetical protein PROVALCAL_02799 [Providencia alcalifaciens DSM 30120]
MPIISREIKKNFKLHRNFLLYIALILGDFKLKKIFILNN